MANCWQCLELENIRLAKIKRYIELTDQLEKARPEGIAPDLEALIQAAKQDLDEAWERVSEHRKSHIRSKESADT